MATVRELVTKWGFEIDQKPLKDLERGIQGAKQSLIAIGAAGAAAGAALFGVAKLTADAGDKAAKAARSIGLSAESLQELAFAADIGGVGQEGLVTTMQKLSRAANEAGDGVATYKDAFDELGISVKDQNGDLKNSDVLLSEISDSFKDLPDGTKKTALAMDLMGRSGAKMISVLNGGSESLEALKQEARDSGFVISEANTVLSEEFNDSLTRLMSVLEGVKRQIGVQLLGPIKEIVDSMREWVLANKEIIKQNLKAFFQSLISVVKTAIFTFKQVFNFVNNIVTAFGGWERAIKFVTFALIGLFGAKFLIAIGSMLQGIFGLIKAFSLFGNASLIASAKALVIPLLIGAAFAALGLAIEDIIAYFNGEDSVTGVMIQKFQEFFSFMEEGFSKFGAIGQFITTVLLTPIRTVVAAAKTLGGVLGALSGGDIGGAFDAVKEGFGSAFGAFGDIFSGEGTSIKGALGFNSSETPRASNSAVNNVSNKIEVNVPEGLNAEQAAQATQAGVKDAMASVLRETQRQVSSPIEE